MSCILQVQPSTPPPRKPIPTVRLSFCTRRLLDVLLSTSYYNLPPSQSPWGPVAPLQKRPGAIQALPPEVGADPALLRKWPMVLLYEL